MKKKVLLGVLIIFLILTIFSAQAQTNSTEEQNKVNDAYQCLEDKTETCSSLSTEEKIFSLLAIDECQSDVVSDSFNGGECWPDGNCNIKTTAQAVLALDNTNANTEEAETWLLSQNTMPSELTWYLEIESQEPTTCTLSYSGFSHTVSIGEDKKISKSAGSCLIRDQDDYWLRIPPACYDEEFEISCNQDFLTTLLFKKAGSSTIHVSSEASSAATGGTTTEKVDSFCFAENDRCTYEGSLWAALVLDSLGEDISSYLPYLITFAEDNEKFVPEAFLYFITGDTEYRTSLLSKQKSSKWWMESGDKFYDTALALYPFQQETIIEKTNSKNWLFEVQDSNGCWDSGNIRNTAFILASIWPKDFGGDGVEELPDCKDAGYYCSSAGNCGGEIFAEYDCPALFVCCSIEPTQETCAEAGGEVCSSSETCKGGTTISTPDLRTGEECCVEGGYCETSVVQENECEISGGICRAYGCNENEEESFYLCEFSTDTCCVSETKKGGGYWWIWVLLILIVLVIIGIIFRDKLRIFWFRIKSKFGKSKPRGPPGPRRFGPSHYPPPRRRFPVERRILPATSPARKPAPGRKSGAQKELDDVLKKLKDMGK